MTLNSKPLVALGDIPSVFPKELPPPTTFLRMEADALAGARWAGRGMIHRCSRFTLGTVENGEHSSA